MRLGADVVSVQKITYRDGCFHEAVNGNDIVAKKYCSIARKSPHYRVVRVTVLQQWVLHAQPDQSVRHTACLLE